MNVFGGVLWLAVAKVAAAQESGCSFCSNGMSVRNPDRVIQMTETTITTCGILEKESHDEFLVETYGCNFYQYYAHMCGCPDSREGDDELQECQICQDSDEEDNVNGEQKINGHTCQEMKVEARFDPHGLGCSYYHYLGSMCGCKSNKPPEDGCQLCYDGELPPFAAQQVRLPGVETGTCQHVSEYTQYVHDAGSKECYSTQSTLGGYCGCDVLTQPVSRCPICAENKFKISNTLSPKFQYLSPNGNTKIHQSGMSCLDVEMLANNLVVDSSDKAQGTCSAIRDQVADVCCVSNVLTSGSTKEESAGVSSLIVSYNNFEVVGAALLSACWAYFM